MVDANSSSDNLRAQALAILISVRDQLADLQSAAAATTDAGLQDKLQGATGSLAGVEGQLSQALNSQQFPLSLTELMMLSRTVQATNTTALVSQATMATATAIEREVVAASGAARATALRVGDDLFTRHTFDPYLKFDSAEDEDDYRKRREERRQYAANELSHETPVGNLNASGAEQAQMLDDNTHGAGKSPHWQSDWDELTSKTRDLRAKIKAQGQSTEEYDRGAAQAVHEFLKNKGMSESEIAARLAAVSDPLDALKFSGGKEKEANLIDKGPHIPARDSDPAADMAALGSNSDQPAPAPGTIPGMDALSAKLKGAGIVVAANASDSGHGLQAALRSATTDRAAPTPT